MEKNVYDIFCPTLLWQRGLAETNVIMVFSYRPPKKRKEIKLFTRETPNKQKEEQEIFLGFLLIITTTSMKIKLAKSYY